MANLITNQLEVFVQINRKIVFIITFTLFFGLINSCSPIETNYISYKIGGVSVCDLNFLDTAEMLQIDQINVNLSSSEVISRNIKTNIRWMAPDTIWSRCSSKRTLETKKILRLFIEKERWSHGFQFSYDLYFDDNEQLLAIESSHRYIDYD